MLGLELVVALGFAVLVGGALARRVRVATPVVRLAAGALLSLLPHVGHVGLPPETVLLLFLPALLYWESLTTSLREIRRFIRGVFLTGTVLVALTAAAVAVVGHALGLSWSTAWIMGAALAPTDATAVAALGRLLPGRSLTVLRAESLVNDGMALVIYGLAVGIATGEATLSAGHVTLRFLVSFLGGTAIGLAVGWLLFALRSRIRDVTHNNLVNLLTPFVAFLLAEEVHASGVLAVVTAGLYVSQAAPRAISAATRQQATPFWSLTTFLLNGGLFVLVGLQIPAAVRGLTSVALGRGVLVASIVYVTLPVVRLGFLIASAYIIRALDRRPAQRALRATNRSRVVSTTAGFRGAVSLAVALSVPTGLEGRDMIIFVPALVVLMTLVIQGLALPAVIRWARLPHDTTTEDETHLALRVAAEEALADLPAMADELRTDGGVVDLIRGEYEARLDALRSDDGEAPAQRRLSEEHELRLALIRHKRATVVRLRDEGVIDDTVLRLIQARLDTEEVRLTGEVSMPD